MTETLEFTPWPKTFRLNRRMIVTEKIDGTNAAVIVSRLTPNQEAYGAGDDVRWNEGLVINLDNTGRTWDPALVAAQSRKRLISPEKDNFGFARFVHDYARTFAAVLGEGVHFGEWYGSGIQRGYSTGTSREKRFMLFNTTRWGDVETRQELLAQFDGRVEVATVLFEGAFDVSAVDNVVAQLKLNGSQHVPGFMNPEGVVVHHTQSGWNFKVTCEKDEQPKGVPHA